MKTRILTAVIGIPLLLIVLFLLPPIGLNIAMSLVCALAIFEILSALQLRKYRFLAVVAVAFGAVVPFFYRMNSFLPVGLILLGFALLLMIIQITHSRDLPAEKVGMVFLEAMVSVLSLGCLAYLRSVNLRGDPRDGLFYVLLALIIPWMSDVGAYFTGTFLGKHKLCPAVSPKKTVEGLLGGMVVSVGCSALAGFLYQSLALGDTATVDLTRVVLLAVVCAPLSVIGDLYASVVKRQNKLKDYGNIIPGHGGVMDRFDSLVIVTPLLLLVVQYWPLIHAG